MKKVVLVLIKENGKNLLCSLLVICIHGRAGIPHRLLEMGLRKGRGPEGLRT